MPILCCQWLFDFYLNVSMKALQSLDITCHQLNDIMLRLEQDSILSISILRVRDTKELPLFVKIVEELVHYFSHSCSRTYHW